MKTVTLTRMLAAALWQLELSRQYRAGPAGLPSKKSDDGAVARCSETGSKVRDFFHVFPCSGP